MAKFLDAVIRLKDNFSKPLQRIDNTVKDFSKTTRNLGRDIKSTGRYVSNMGKNITKSFTLPVVGIGTAVSKIGMDFEKQMSYVKAVTGSTSEEMQKLEKAARDAGSKTSKSSREAAEALGYMGLAGWSVKDSINGLMPILRLAEAGNIELGRASDLVINSMNTMGITVDEMPKYLDAVAQGARSASTDIDQLLEAILGVGGSLKATKVDMKEGIAVIGALGNAGIKASEAGTALSAILTNLSVKRGAVGNALKELKINPFDKDGTFKGVESFFGELNDKLKTMTDEQSQRILGMIAGKEHIKSAQAIMTAIDNGSLIEINKRLKDSNGALNSMASTMLENNLGSITILKSALEELALKIYEILSPKISDITLKIRKFVKVLDEMNPVLRENIIKIAMFVATTGPIILVIGTLTSKIGHCIMTVGKLGMSIKTAGSIVEWFHKPGIIIVGVIGAIIIASILLYKNWDKIKNKAEKIFPNINLVVKSTFINIQRNTIKFINLIKSIISKGLGLLKSFWLIHSEEIINIIKNVVAIIKGVFIVMVAIIKAIIYVFIAIWKIFGDIIINTTKTVWNYINNIISSNLKIIKGVLDVFIGIFTLSWIRSWEGAGNIVKGIFDKIIFSIKCKLNIIINIINGITSKFEYIGIKIPKIHQLNDKPFIVSKIEEEKISRDDKVITKILDRPVGYNFENKLKERISQSNNYNKNTKVEIPKLADQIIIREEADIDKFAKSLVRNLEKTKLNMA